MARVLLSHPVLLVSGLYLLSNLTGFAARLLINMRFGAGAEQDALRAAFVVPDLLFNVLAGGALASAFIPTYVARLSHDQRAHARRLALATAALLFVVVGTCAALAGLAAPWLVREVVARAFDESQVARTAALMRLLLVGTTIFGISGLMMGVLQSNQRFLAPALAPSLYQLGLIVGALVFADHAGIEGVAWGAVLGALLHFGVQLPDAIRVMRLPRDVADPPSFAALRADLQQIVALMPPRMMGLGAVQINNVVNTTLASSTLGGVSAFNNAFAILVLPIAAIGQAVGTVLFPTISAHLARDERAHFATAFNRALGQVIALSVPAATGLMVIGEPIIRLLFERGAFDARATAWVAFALSWLALGLPAHAALELVTRAFYAMKDSLRPALAAVFSVAVNILLSIVLFTGFAQWGLSPIGGLGLANALATIGETALLYRLLVKREPHLRATRWQRTLLKSAAAALGMALALKAWTHFFGEEALAVVTAIALGTALYFAVLLSLRAREAQRVLYVLRAWWRAR